AAVPDAAAGAPLPLGQAPPRSRSPTDAMAAPSSAAGVAAVGGVLVLLVAGVSCARLPARGAAIRGAALPRGGAPATAVFALGSFWRSEPSFGFLPGVIRTCVSKANPEYPQPRRARRVRQG
ncbi:unnamed protein product, partial [Urochloa humidicola]